jgi:hypothetical protein
MKMKIKNFLCEKLVDCNQLMLHLIKLKIQLETSTSKNKELIELELKSLNEQIDEIKEQREIYKEILIKRLSR